MNKLEQLAKLIRYYILTSTTKAGSGHPTSSLSATDLMTTLMFGGYFRADLNKPQYYNNDRLIFSKGHAAPLLYALYGAAGKLTEKELLTLRKFGSPLEGHPSLAFPYTEAATGSLGQGLSIGVGMALNAKLDGLPYKTFVLLGDSEMAEGSNWEAMALASHYKLDNLVGIIDVNRLGQRGETMSGYHLNIYKKRAEAFGWQTYTVDGHDVAEIAKVYKKALQVKNKPVMIIAKTLKGAGISFLENKENWHGKALSTTELAKALLELGQLDKKLRGQVKLPRQIKLKKYLPVKKKTVNYKLGEVVATRKAYGNALVKIHSQIKNLVVLDAETSNSTYAEIFKKAYPKRFLEMFIAEQNMLGVALGLSKRGKKPFASTFAAFWSRAFDQIRMSQYSEPDLVLCGSHAGVSIGVDGPSQMALEDLAMIQSVINSTVLYPADAVSTEKLVALAAQHKGLTYIRTTRMATSVLYKQSDKFKIGGSKVLRQNLKDRVTVVGAGVTLHEALKAYEELKKQHINIRVIDLYSIKPIDKTTLRKAAKATGKLIVVEDHHAQGGMFTAVNSALAQDKVKIYSLAVMKLPKSGQPQELLAYESIDSRAIIRQVKKIIK